MAPRRGVARGALVRALALVGGLGIAAGVAAMLVTGMPGTSHRGPLPPLTDLERELAGRLRGHVEHLAGTIGERSVWQTGTMERAAAYIEAGLAAAGPPVRREPFASRGETVANLYVDLPGAAPERPLLVVGAHYDTVPGSPGANDNASGVAALLELARLLSAAPLPGPLRLVAFANEEAPFYGTPEMGSARHAAGLAREGVEVAGMLSLETMGWFSDAPGSQRYPPPLGLFYPEAGDFIGFVGDFRSRALVRKAVKAFRDTTAFPAEGVAAPRAVPGVAWSDHASFWEQGWPALMVTDTAPYRYPHYHRPSDSPEQVDYEGLARVVAGLARALPRIPGD